MESLYPAFVTAAVAACIGLIAFFWSGHLTPTTAAAKIWDRIYLLDQEILKHPDAYLLFIQQAQRPQPDYFASTEINTHYVKLKTLCYMHMNIFEEIYLTAHASRLIAWRLEAQDWEAWIVLRMRHPLLRELWVEYQGKYDRQGKFEKFLQAKKAEIEEPLTLADVKIW